jgi:S1-C subfamily serine protease
MTEGQDLHTEPRPKLLASRAARLQLAAASGLVLAVGAWLAPRAAQTPLAAPQEHAAPLIEEQVQRREAARPFSGVEDVAARVRAHVAAIPSAAGVVERTGNDFTEPASEGPPPAGFGVFISDRHLLTHRRALEGRASARVVTASGADADARLLVYEQSSGLVLLEIEPAIGTAAPLAMSSPAPGSLGIAVGHAAEGGDIAVPVFITSSGASRYTLGRVDDVVRPGMPVFTIDGELLAVAAPNTTRVHAFPAREAAGRLLARNIAGEQPSSFGMRLQALSGLLTRSFGAEGVVVTEVMPGGPAAGGGIEAGDVLLAVGDTLVDSVPTAVRALSSRPLDAPTGIRLRRNGAARMVEISPIPAFDAVTREPGSDDAGAADARTILPEPWLEAGGIAGDARVLSINGRAVASRAQATRALRTRPDLATILVRQGGETFFVAIEPPR